MTPSSLPDQDLLNSYLRIAQPDVTAIIAVDRLACYGGSHARSEPDSWVC